MSYLPKHASDSKTQMGTAGKDGNHRKFRHWPQAFLPRLVQRPQRGSLEKFDTNDVNDILPAYTKIDKEYADSSVLPVLSASITQAIAGLQKCSEAERSCGRKTSRLHAALREQLRIVELGHPNLVLCATCAKFHPRPSTSSHETLPYQSRSLYNIGGSDCDANNQTLRLGSHWSLPWWLAHLIMRTYRLSLEHGLPLNAIQFMDTRNRKWKRTVSTRVVDDRLLIKWEIDHVICGTEELKLDLCYHEDKYVNIRKMCETLLSRYRCRPGDLQQGAERGKKFHCPWCPTEYRITVSRSQQVYLARLIIVPRTPPNLSALNNPDPMRPRILIQKWIDLGKCEPVQDLNWLALVNFEHEPADKKTCYDLRGLKTIESRFEDTNEPLKSMAAL